MAEFARIHRQIVTRLVRHVRRKLELCNGLLVTWTHVTRSCLPMCLFSGAPGAVRTLFSTTTPSAVSACLKAEARATPESTICMCRPVDSDRAVLYF